MSLDQHPIEFEGQTLPLLQVDAATRDAAGKCGGKYLDKIGVTDLAKLNEQQWHRFIECVLGGAIEQVLDTYIVRSERLPISMNEVPY